MGGIRAFMLEFADAVIGIGGCGGVGSCHESVMGQGKARCLWLLALGMAACAPARFHPVPPPGLDDCAIEPTWTSRPGRFAVVADSQFNTPRSGYRSIYRRRPIDRVIDVAIRPPALDLASHFLLRSILGKQVADGAEVIFYLGDGANNGCADELVGRREVDGMDGIFTVLRQARARFGVPIFFVLGNHDYLGAGNTSAWMATRRALCNADRDGRNAPLTKFEVMREVHAFNAESAAMAPHWQYRDSWAAKPLARACNGGGGYRPRNQHLRRGCYLAAVLADRRDGREYLLLDSNDYGDVPGSMFFAGRRGGASFRKLPGPLAQTRWLLRAADPEASLRIVLSHYDLDTINTPDGQGAAHERLGQLIVPRRSLWLSAHTHHPNVRRFRQSLRATRGAAPVRFTEINVGSATDWPAHALVSEAAVDADRGLAALVRPTHVFAITPERCEETLEALSRVTGGSKFFPFRRHTRGLGLFGLDFLLARYRVQKEYRTHNWTRADDQHVRANLATWLDEHAPQPAGDRCGWPTRERLTAGACVGLYASLQEGVKQGWAPVACERCDAPMRRGRGRTPRVPGDR